MRAHGSTHVVVNVGIFAVIFQSCEVSLLSFLRSVQLHENVASVNVRFCVIGPHLNSLLQELQTQARQVTKCQSPHKDFPDEARQVNRTVSASPNLICFLESGVVLGDERPQIDKRSEVLRRHTSRVSLA